MFSKATLTNLVLAGSFCVQQTAAYPGSNASCKCIPGDACWPNAQAWAKFNETIGGKLITSVQLASVCHTPYYDEAACAYMQKEWTNPWLHDQSSSSIMAAAVAANTCDAFTDRDLPCEAGASVSYSVNATDANDFSDTIAFAKANNIRLVIRNTGHDYLGKSTGQWALSLWTHHMKQTEYIPSYNGSGYAGPAMKLGAGVQVQEAYEAAHAHGALAVGGDCASVGVVGGYLQGGGHSALSSLYGMAADHVLAWEVVDGAGRHLTAAPDDPATADLYWALGGGGGGTYAVAVAATIKLFPDSPMTGVQLGFSSASASSSSSSAQGSSSNQTDAAAAAFQQAVQKYHDLVPAITAPPRHGMGIAEITDASFLLTPLTLPNGTREEAAALLAPLTGALEGLGLEYSLNISSFPSWLAYWRALIEPNPTQLVHNAQYGGWLVPRALLAAHPERLAAAVRDVTAAGCVFVGLALNVSGPAVARNAIRPSWREAAMNTILSTPWPAGADLADMKVRADTMTQTCVPALSKLAPEAGAYFNEADPNQPDWKEAFYGPNYDRLLAVKAKYDPHHLFYATTAVGSDYYELDEAGRLCRAV
ncbi:isoamyl alcohol oxidase [Xylariomycetidae sp. FL0641]|nr:isoamyl alcohol oxidase [Xylariomycetidae sp. FL0641]